MKLQASLSLREMFCLLIYFCIVISSYQHIHLKFLMTDQNIPIVDLLGTKGSFQVLTRFPYFSQVEAPIKGARMHVFFLECGEK